MLIVNPKIYSKKVQLMTREQFDRWQDFAVRMAIHGYPRATERRREKIRKEIQNYFDEREYQEDWPVIDDWDYNDDFGSLSGDVDDFFERYRHWRRNNADYVGWFFCQITCCIRAGFDMAVKQSGGVLGFTAGDLRRMYDGNIPDWITRLDWATPLALIPDEAPVWL